MTSPAVRVIVTVDPNGGATVAVNAPASPLSATCERPDKHLLRIAIRGRGAFVLLFSGIDVRDLDVRGGHIFAEPGPVCTVRGEVDGWLSITAKLARPRAPAP